eukprot:jgi/Botrbrau1/19560/Bobra.0035s0052.1
MRCCESMAMQSFYQSLKKLPRFAMRTFRQTRHEAIRTSSLSLTEAIPNLKSIRHATIRTFDRVPHEAVQIVLPVPHEVTLAQIHHKDVGALGQSLMK